MAVDAWERDLLEIARGDQAGRVRLHIVHGVQLASPPASASGSTRISGASSHPIGSIDTRPLNAHVQPNTPKTRRDVVPTHAAAIGRGTPILRDREDEAQYRQHARERGEPHDDLVPGGWFSRSALK